MSSTTFTSSEAHTFTITNAKYLASKVETDLMRLHRYYAQPTLQEIRDYYEELVLLQTFDFLDEIAYGFVMNGRWVKALKYVARQGGILTADDDPGGIRFSKLPDGAEFSSVLRYNCRWGDGANISDRKSFLRQTPIERNREGDYHGKWVEQRAYSSGGRGLVRSGI